MRAEICYLHRELSRERGAHGPQGSGVFLSSTAVDLADYRKAVHERLMRTGLFHCVRQEDFSARNAGAVEFCRQEAREANMFAGLIGLRRGLAIRSNRRLI